MDTRDDEPRSDGGHSLSRRDLLKGASALAVMPMLPLQLPRWAPTAAAVPAAPVVQPLSVGYIVGSDDWPDLSGIPWAPDGVFGLRQVVPATSGITADLRLLGKKVRIGVRGVFPSFQGLAGSTLSSLTLDQVVGADAAGAVPFYALTLTAGRPGKSSNAAVQRLIVDRSRSLSFVLGKNPGGVRMSREFGFSAGRDIANLRRGCYLLAIHAGSWDKARLLPEPSSAKWAGLASVVVTVDH